MNAPRHEFVITPAGRPALVESPSGAALPARLVTAFADSAGTKKKTLAAADVAGVFGIEKAPADTPAEPTARPPRKKAAPKPAAKKTAAPKKPRKKG